MKVYKFRSSEQISFIFDILLNKRLYCADWKNLNDPINVPKNVPLKRLDKIIAIMQENKDITIDGLAQRCDVSSKTIKRDIAKLKELGRVEHVGSLKSGYWRVLS